jgi:hypothetical protein
LATLTPIGVTLSWFMAPWFCFVRSSGNVRRVFS